MTTKEQALYTLMESQGYSYGLMQTALHLLGQSKEALDEMIVFVEDRHPSEEEFIGQMAALCEKRQQHGI
ncbi:hypothetical protein [Marseilla massiliensis]|jgi:hypothetical protein|uniref:hypothetical protein n=1 Tax=Marseilla massiliensis TaxID=1841864 RepID=UPI00258453F0|nr:hypothetical protein [uncultured Mediterranea sp.]